jgi:biopolymer transport protein ExbB
MPGRLAFERASRSGSIASHPVDRDLPVTVGSDGTTTLMLFDVSRIIDAFGYAIYATLAVLAVWGVYNSILLYRGLAKKSLRDPEPLIAQVRELYSSQKYDAAVAVCQSPTYWHTALAQLMAVAIENRMKSLSKIKQLLVLEFHNEVIAGMENRLASLSTIVRMGPLLGLLGTVASMIAAFARIGGAEKVDPQQLASDISLALWATGGGLLIANPMMLIGNDMHARLRRLRDRTERQLQDFLEILEEGEPHLVRGQATAHPAAPAPAEYGAKPARPR